MLRQAGILVAAMVMAVTCLLTPAMTGVAEAASFSTSKAVAVGGAHGCAITGDIVRCWGSNALGQLGDGSRTSSASPVAVLASAGGKPLAGVVALAAGSSFTCALLASGGVRCWGAGSSGQLGNGSTAYKTVPSAVYGITTATAIAAGASHACARLSSGAVRCWGLNSSGQLGDGTRSNRTRPVTVKSLTAVTAIAAGASHSCAITGSSKSVKCWGLNSSGQLGDGTRSNRTKPVTVKSLTGALGIAAGASHTCAITGSSRAVKCWGLNTYGQLGDGTTTRRLLPVTVKSLSSATALGAGAAHACARLSSGLVKCWGLNSSGQIGDGTTTRRLVPVVAGMTGAGGIAAGAATTCAYVGPSDVRCWGGNGSGQLGDGTKARHGAPAPIVGVVASSIAGIVAPGVLPNDGSSRARLDGVVRDAGGFAVAGAEVRYYLGGGSDLALADAATYTGSTGVASTVVTASSTAGANTLWLFVGTSDVYATASLEERIDGAVTLDSSPGGTISPSGTARHPFGTVVHVTVTPDDPADTPSLVVDGAPVALTPPVSPATAWAYDLTVTGVHHASATYARLTPGTVVLDTAAAARFIGITTGGTSVSFSAHTPQLDGLAVGNIIAAGVGSGLPPFLLRVTAINGSGPGVTLTTSPADLVDAIQGASVDVNVPVLETVPASAGPVVHGLATSTITGSASVTLASWGASATASSGPLSASASVRLDGPTIDVAMKLVTDAFPNCANAALVCGKVTSFKAGLSESALASVELSASKSYSKEWEKVLASHAFNSVVVLAGIPVPVTLSLDAGVGAKVDFKATLSTSATWSGSLSAGVQWTPGAGWSQYHDATASFTYQPPVLSASATVRGYPFFDATPAIGFDYGGAARIFCGPYLRLEPGYLELDADTTANPWWTLDAGVQLSGGAHCSFGDAWTAGAIDLVKTRIAQATGAHTAVKIAAGQDHACALIAGGTVECWGGAGALGDGSTGDTMTELPGSTTPVAAIGITGAVDLAAGTGSTCAVLADGTVSCWGGITSDGTNPGSDVPVTVAGVTNATAVSVGAGHACAIVFGGYLQCWGYNYDGELGNGTTGDTIVAPVWVYGISTASSVAAGTAHTCARLTDGTIRCWGSNNAGQLGLGYADDAAHPWPATVYGISTATAVAAGTYMSSMGPFDTGSCALLANQTVRCWGDNGAGQLGVGSTDSDPHPYPVQVSGVGSAVGITMGAFHACAVLSNHTAACWGGNWSAELGLGYRSTTDGVPTPTAVSGLATASQAAAGGEFTCFLRTDGTVVCTGDNTYGQLGHGWNVFETTPLAVAMTDAASVAGGGGHTCAVAGDGTVRCWGDNSAGQLGDGTTTDRFAPTLVSGISNARAVAVGWSHACAVLLDGTVRCWGDNTSGQLGDGTTSGHASPTPVTGISTATAISAAANTTCVRLSSGALRCWGDGSSGQLGNGAYTNAVLPVSVYGVTTATSVSVSSDHACARLANASVRCWGSNWRGQLGDGTSTDRTRPVTVSGLTAAAVSTGDGFSCALLSTTSVKCWGSNLAATLGRGTSDDSVHAAPLAVPSLTGVEELDASGSRACVRLASGGVKCWGYRGVPNNFWELVYSYDQLDLNPTAVPGITSATSIGVASAGACARLADATIRCWGWNWNGQLGIGHAGFSTTPLEVVGL